MSGFDPKGTAYPGRPAEGGPAPRSGSSGTGSGTGPGNSAPGFARTPNQVTAPGGTGDLHAGVVLGKYQIVRRLGAGGMGSVYEAVHTHIGKSVALKTMNPALTSDPRAEARFMREAAAASRLGHPNVVDVTDYGSDQGVVYIVMEILRGDDLSTLVQHAPAGLDTAFAADVMLAVCAGVFAAHEKGVVHRDLKPQNIFLARTPLGDVVPKVLDFGISKLLDEEVQGGLTNSGSVMGTTHYLSPEQVTGQPVDGRSDEFALGVILFECLTGQRPHQGDTVFTIMRAISEGRFQRPRVLRPDMVPALEAVILRAMAVRPEDRYPTVHAMGNGLLPYASPRAQVMWGDYFARPPASAAGGTSMLNPVYAPPAPASAGMMGGTRAFGADTRSGSGVGPVSVIGTNEFEQQRGPARSRFRGLLLGGLLGAVAAAVAIVNLRPGLLSGSGTGVGPVEHGPAVVPSAGTTSAPPARTKPRGPAEPAVTAPKTVPTGVATPDPGSARAADPGFDPGSDSTIGNDGRPSGTEAAQPRTKPRAAGDAPARDTAPTGRSAAARAAAEERANQKYLDKYLDKYDERSLRRDKAEARKAAARAASLDRDPEAASPRRPEAAPRVPPAVRTKPTYPKVPDDVDVIEGPRAPTSRIKAPILE